MKQFLLFYAILLLVTISVNATAPCMECDTLLMKDNRRLVVKIAKLDAEKVAYRLCDSLDTQIRFFNRDQVNGIIYHNGKKNIWNTRPPKTASVYTGCSPKLDMYSFLSMLLGALAIGPLALFFGILGLSTTLKHEDEWYGKDYAIWGIVLGTIATITWLIVLF